MTRRLVDCGFIIGVLDLDSDGKPTLELMQPEREDSAAQSMMIWDTEGLDNLRDALGEFLDEWASGQGSPEGFSPQEIDAGD